MVYANFWGLSFPPFADDNRPDTFVPVRSVSLALARLRYALGTIRGAAALFGSPGIGKTRAVKMLLREFEAAGWLTAYLPNPSGTVDDIFAVLNPAGANQGKPAGIAGLQVFLSDLARANRPALLAVDDVQAARGSDFLETLRTLLNMGTDERRALSLLLIGQDGMERKLAVASSFNTRLDARAIIEPMTDEETKLYILARLKAAGSRHGIFTRQAAEMIVELARGNPRQVNRLCDTALVVAFGLESTQVGPEIVEMAAGDLDILPGGAPFLLWPHPEPEGGGEEGGDAQSDDHAEDILAGLASGE
ncbi:MAG: AAA family ATPase [Planctomycetota bacterium]|jgi:general secretion pathway protein A|nr:AAA family ATPase [Planctomycetota bacterium]